MNVLRAHQVHIMFRARLIPSPSFGVGPESLETRLYDESEIPWPEIAFLSVEFALRRYLEDRRAGRRAPAFPGHRLARRQAGDDRSADPALMHRHSGTSTAALAQCMPSGIDR